MECNKVRYKPTREFFIPKTYQLIARDDAHGFECWGIIDNEPGRRTVAIAFGGKRNKPDWHYRFQDEARLRAKIDETLRGYAQSAQIKAERKAKRNAPHDVKVGDVFKASWGYDQTNIDFYECTRVISASTIEIRPIAQDSEETMSMQGECVPMRGAYIGEPMRKRVSMAGGEPSVSITSYSSAYRMKPVAIIAGAPVYQSSHWTAYA